MAELHRLKNGMEVLLEENHASPVISFYLLVKAGSAMEKRDEAGICHVIEHMLFKGTPTRSVGEIAKDVEAAGGEINAYTSLDQTVYFINMASRFSCRGLEILSDVIANPLFDPEELEREKEVVLEEIRREKDNPSHRSSELMFSKAYRFHPYKYPIIGNEKTIKSFTRRSLLDFYKCWYTPRNMTLTVVGDFKSAEMLKSVKKMFGRLKGRPAPVAKLPQEPAQKEMTIYMEENPINSTYFIMSFHIPEVTSRDIPALDVVAHVLASNDSSRLQQEIREKKQLVNAVYSYAFTPRDPGLLLINGLTPPEKAARAITSIWDELLKFHTHHISSDELSRAKLSLRSHQIYEKETTSGQAGKYTYFIATTGTHLFEKEYYQMLSEVSKNDVRSAAERYLVPANLNIVMVHPKGSKNVINSRAIKNYICRSKPRKGIAAKKFSKVLPPTLHRLSNGTRLVVREDHINPLVSCCAALHGGLRFEHKDNNGINNLLAQVITKGTKDKSALEIAEQIESMAGALDGFSGRNSFGLRSDFLSEKIDEGFNLFTEVLTGPGFTPAEIAIEKRQVLDAIKNEEDALASLSFIKFFAALFPSHPYGLRALGTKATVRGLNRRKLSDYHRHILRPENLVISVVGDVLTGEIIEAAEKRIVFERGTGKKFPNPAPEQAQKKPIRIDYRRPEKEQAHIVIGFLGPTICSKDHYTVAVLNNILSGQGGRLFLKLRDQMSLAYSISSTYFAGLEPGYIAVYIGTEPSKVDIAIGEIMGEFKRLVKKGVSARELAQAKNHIIGSYELDRQRSSNLSGNYAFNVLYGLGIKEVDEYPKKIGAVSCSDIINATRKYIRVDAPVTAVVRPN